MSGRETGVHRRPEGTFATTRRADGVVETTLTGRVSTSVLEAFGASYMEHGGPLWIIVPDATVTYDAAAVPAASMAFVRWARHGLGLVVLVTRTASLRMAAISIRLGVKLATGVTIEVVERRDDAERLLFGFRRGLDAKR